MTCHIHGLSRMSWYYADFAKQLYGLTLCCITALPVDPLFGSDVY